MLHGTVEEYEYHAERALQELESAERCRDHSAKIAHRALADLHMRRLDVVAALRKFRSVRVGKPIVRTDKEG